MRYKTLIIDDDPISRLLLKKKLEKNHISDTPLMFENGEVAMDYINSCDNEPTYLIYLDINMPVMNGWDFLSRMEQKENLRDYYVFITTSSTDVVDKEHAAEYRSVINFISKPITDQQVLACKTVFQTQN